MSLVDTPKTPSVSDEDKLVPVTLLCGFLGSGKTTLLKHILETKHSDEKFKCAVIVNDVAELNIDKTLIESTSLIQSEEAMVSMQNGCICCSLQSDLCDQIIKLTQTMNYNYILIEASGVSEPHEIAPLFEVHNHDDDDEPHDHEHDPDKPQLGEVARLDTCVTMIDQSDFYTKLGSMMTYDQGDIVGTITELMMDQVEFANVIVLNKSDLVSEKVQVDIQEKISILNPKARIVKNVTNSNINVLDILNTKSYKDKEEFWVTSTKNPESVKEEDCCTRNSCKDTCKVQEARFGIKSFIYRARRPFHPGRLEELVLEPYFVNPKLNLEEEEDDDEEISEEEKVKREEEKKKKKELELAEREELQKIALVKQKRRNADLGDLLRSKGFLWMATSHDIIGAWQQAGNVLRVVAEMPWMCKMPLEIIEAANIDLIKADMTGPDGEEYLYKDRRQELVFIGHRMKADVIRKLFDECLLTDEEMSLGDEKWKELWDDLDTVNLWLPDGDSDEESEDEEGDSDEEGDEDELNDVAANKW